MSPTTILSSPALPLHAPVAMQGTVRGVPGVWDEGGRWVGAGEGYTGTQPDHAQDPYSVIF